MFQFILGAIIGLFISMISLSLLVVNNAEMELSIFANIVIAIATTVAVAIHYDSKRLQRKDRVWDINKVVLLDLTHALSEVINETENEIRDIREGIVISNESSDVWTNLSEKIDYALGVYKTLMSPDMLQEIKTSKENNDQIGFDVASEDLDTLSAFELSLENYKKLYISVTSFIAEVSGINT